MSETTVTNPTGSDRRRTSGEIQDAFTEMLVGPQEQPEQDSSEEEQLESDSVDEEQELEAELTDDSVADEDEDEEYYEDFYQ